MKSVKASMDQIAVAISLVPPQLSPYVLGFLSSLCVTHFSVHSVPGLCWGKHVVRVHFRTQPEASVLFGSEVGLAGGVSFCSSCGDLDYLVELRASEPSF